MQVLSLILAFSIYGIRLWIISALIGCSGSKNPFSGEKDGNQSYEAQLNFLVNNPAQIGFDQVYSFVLKNNCVECHSGDDAPNGLEFDTYKNLIGSSSQRVLFPYEPNESTFYTSLIAKGGSLQMPPLSKPQLSGPQKELIFQWIKSGVPEKAGTNGVPQFSLAQQLQPYFDNPETIDYEVVNNYVFKSGHCVDCHSHSGQAADYKAITFGANLSTYKDLFLLGGINKGHGIDTIEKSPNGGMVLNPGSNIYKSVAVEQSMPPISEGYQPLNSLRVKLLRLWILNCAIENYDETEILSDLSEFEAGKVRNCRKTR